HATELLAYNSRLPAARLAHDLLLHETAPAAPTRSTSRFTAKHLPRHPCLAKGPRRSRVGHAAVALQQLDHGPVTLAICLEHRVSAGVNPRIRIRATLEQHLCHGVLGGTGAVPQRHTPGECHLVPAAEAYPLVRVETE